MKDNGGGKIHNGLDDARLGRLTSVDQGDVEQGQNIVGGQEIQGGRGQCGNGSDQAATQGDEHGRVWVVQDAPCVEDRGGGSAGGKMGDGQATAMKNGGEGLDGGEGGWVMGANQKEKGGGEKADEAEVGEQEAVGRGGEDEGVGGGDGGGEEGEVGGVEGGVEGLGDGAKEAVDVGGAWVGGGERDVGGDVLEGRGGVGFWGGEGGGRDGVGEGEGFEGGGG